MRAINPTASMMDIRATEKYVVITFIFDNFFKYDKLKSKKVIIIYYFSLMTEIYLPAQVLQSTNPSHLLK